MGWVVAVVLLPVAFALVAAYAVVKLTMLMLRIVFMPVMLMRRR
ncbi:MAG TPA: hypothetical protein VK490_05310 [Gaiellaceae bacterium]|jgi:hypothetical protein|nr:hypothetical protein [Gaiellaceae bacterium]